MTAPPHASLTRRVATAVVALLLAQAAQALPSAGTDAPSAEQRAHAAHHHAMNEETIKRALIDIVIPAVRLVRDDGRGVSLVDELADARPVYVDFIYTTCTAICPVTSATFAALQDKLGADRDKVRMMSISIDPEEDNPHRLTEFRQKYGAGPQWHHYTGTAEASVAAQRAFGVYTGDKMGHTPVTLYRAAPGSKWVRLDGFASPDELLHEYRTSIAAR